MRAFQKKDEGNDNQLVFFFYFECSFLKSDKHLLRSLKKPFAVHGLLGCFMDALVVRQTRSGMSSLEGQGHFVFARALPLKNR